MITYKYYLRHSKMIIYSFFILYLLLYNILMHADVKHVSVIQPYIVLILTELL